MNSVPVTENDPLGALTPDTSPVGNKSLHKSATLPSVERTPGGNNVKPDDNILGSPFSSDLSRSSATLPQDSTFNSPSLSSTFSSSIKSLTKTGMSSKLSSLRKGSSNYLQSYLSPNPATSKKTQEALTHGFTR